MGIIKCVCISSERKASAIPVGHCKATIDGLEGDIHFGMEKKKQVSLLPYDRVKEYFTQAGEPIIYGRFGENLVVDGMDWKGIHPGDYFCCEDVALEVMKIGAGGPASDAYTGEKICSPMEPYFIFCRIVQGGILEEGEPIYHT